MSKLVNLTMSIQLIKSKIHLFHNDSMQLVYKDFYIKKTRELYVC